MEAHGPLAQHGAGSTWPPSGKRPGKSNHSLQGLAGVSDLVIIANLCVVVLEADSRAKGEFPHWYDYADHVFSMFFVLEMLARLAIDKMKFFTSYTNFVDLVSILADIILQLVITVTGEKELLCTFRNVRLLRLLRVLRHFRELWSIVYKMVGVARAMVWITALLFCVLLVWSVIAVDVLHPLVQDLDSAGQLGTCTRCVDAFASVTEAASTWFLLIIAGDGELWYSLAAPLAVRHASAAVLTTLVFSTVNLGALTMIVIVIVDRSQRWGPIRNVETLVTGAATAGAGSVAGGSHPFSPLRQGAASPWRSHGAKDCSQGDSMLPEYAHARAMLAKLCAGRGRALTMEEVDTCFDGDSEVSSAIKALNVSKEEMKTAFTIVDAGRAGTVDPAELVNALHGIKTQDSFALLLLIKHCVAELSARSGAGTAPGMYSMRDHGTLAANGFHQGKEGHRLVSPTTQLSAPVPPQESTSSMPLRAAALGCGVDGAAPLQSPSCEMNGVPPMPSLEGLGGAGDVCAIVQRLEAEVTPLVRTMAQRIEEQVVAQRRTVDLMTSMGDSLSRLLELSSRMMNTWSDNSTSQPGDGGTFQSNGRLRQRSPLEPPPGHNKVPSASSMDSELFNTATSTSSIGRAPGAASSRGRSSSGAGRSGPDGGTDNFADIGVGERGHFVPRGPHSCHCQ